MNARWPFALWGCFDYGAQVIFSQPGQLKLGQGYGLWRNGRIRVEQVNALRIGADDHDSVVGRFVPVRKLGGINSDNKGTAVLQMVT